MAVQEAPDHEYHYSIQRIYRTCVYTYYVHINTQCCNVMYVAMYVHVYTLFLSMKSRARACIGRALYVLVCVCVCVCVHCILESMLIGSLVVQ